MARKKKKGRPNYLTAVAMLFAFLFASCATLFPPPEPERTSTSAERAHADSLLNRANHLLTLAYALGAVNEVQLRAGQNSITVLKDRVTMSETVPTNWTTVVDDAFALSIQWLFAEKLPPPAPPPE